jgi:hypothetical protein
MNWLLFSRPAQLVYLLCVTVVGLILYFGVSPVAMWGWLVFTGVLIVAAGYRADVRKRRTREPKNKEERVRSG